MKIKFNAELYNLYKEPSSVKMINTATLEMARKYQGYAPCKKILSPNQKAVRRTKLKKDAEMARFYTKQSKISKKKSESMMEEAIK